MFMSQFRLLLQITLWILWAAPSIAQENDPGTLLFFGDSLTASYGLDPSQGYPAIIQQKLDAAELPWEVVVGAVSGDTSAGGLRRIDWMLQRHIDVFVLALGANDGLRGIDPDSTLANLQAIIDRVKAKYPKAKIIIAGMLMPSSLGFTFSEEFGAIFPNLAKENNATLIPFLLDGVGGNPALNQPDGIHPTAEGQMILAENVWKVIEGVLE